MKNQQKVEAFENNYRGKQLMNRLKIMAAGAALAAVSGGAFGDAEKAKMELDATRGCASWNASFLKVAPSLGVGYVPLCGSIITTREHTFSADNEILAVMKFEEDTTARMYADPSVEEGSKGSYRRFNTRKARGLISVVEFMRGFNDLDLFEDTGATRRTTEYSSSNSTVIQGTEKVYKQAGGVSDLEICFVLQSLPSSPADLYVRPEFAFFPNASIPNREVVFDAAAMRYLAIGMIEKSDVIEDSFRTAARLTGAPSSLTVNLTNEGFTNAVSDTLKVVTADEYTAQQTISFVTYFRLGGRGVLTFHQLLPYTHAQNLRALLRLQALSMQYQDSYFGSFKAIYGTDVSGAATFASNLKAVFGGEVPENWEELEAFWKSKMAAAGIPAFKYVQDTFKNHEGPRALIEILYHLADDFKSVTVVPSGGNTDTECKKVPHCWHFMVAKSGFGRLTG